MKLRATHREAIRLLLTPGVTGQEVAKQLGVQPETVYRWKADPDFKAAMDKARKKVTEARMARVRDDMGELYELSIEAMRSVLSRDEDFVHPITGKPGFPATASTVVKAAGIVMAKVVPDLHQTESTVRDITPLRRIVVSESRDGLQEAMAAHFDEVDDG